jgi:ketosteroid isomerase-like protein
MGQDGADQRTSNLELARVLIPREGNDWGAVIRDKAAEAAFMARVSPLVHPQFETIWRHSPEGSESRTGVEATLAALRQVGAAFESLIAVPELYVDLGDRVLVLLRRSGRTVDGIDFDEEGAVVYSFESGLLKRMELYADRALALADEAITAA